MTAPLPAQPTTITPWHRARIATLWAEGRNTHEIAQKLRLPEAAVADVVRRERERRLGIGGGR